MYSPPSQHFKAYQIICLPKANGGSLCFIFFQDKKKKPAEFQYHLHDLIVFLLYLHVTNPYASLKVSVFH